VALPAVPADAAAQLQWLVDRAAISDLLDEYARCVDDRDWEAFAALFLADGVLEVAGVRLEGERIVTAGDLLAGYDATHHASANQAIHVDGDRASATARVIATHVPDRRLPAVHGDMGGEYACSLQRTDAGWRFAHVRSRTVWTSGTDLPGRR